MLGQLLNAFEGQLKEVVQRSEGDGRIAMCVAGTRRADHHSGKQSLGERIGLKRRRIG